MKSNGDYLIHISADDSPWNRNLRDLWRYRDLIWLFTKRSFTLIYKQTILGPLWIVISPLLTSVVYTAVFGGLAGLSTGGVPKILFYLCSNALWSFFSSCLNNNATTFVTNARMFGKVYFPRLTIPVSNMLSSGIHFLVHMVLACVLIVYYSVTGAISPDLRYLPASLLMILVTGIMGLGLGVLISSVTTKYRDMTFLVGFDLHLWMYASPVIYPASSMTTPLMHAVMLVNPMTAPMELFRMALLGSGSVPPVTLVSTIVFTVLAATIGVGCFNRVERTFIDTV